jgi:hypothetical protein
MPQSLTGRLDTDEEFRKRILKLGQDYVTHARATLDYYTADFDAAHDILMCYATLTKQDYVKLAKGTPRRYILPITATHVHTMTTFLAQTLFGDDTPHKVDAGGPDDDGAARYMNELLKWNAEQQPAGMYQIGFMWIENALTYNRGIFYDCFAPINKSMWQEAPVLDEEGQPTADPDTGQPITSVQKIKTRTGGFNRVELVSPYDFYMDPLMPIYRMQEGRFAGHRINKTWDEIKNRSELEPDDPMYLSARGVNELKKKPTKSIAYPTSSTATGPTGQDLISRTAYERGKVATPVDSRADAKDPGVIDFVELWVKIIPKDYDIDDRTDPEVFQIILGNEKEPLACNESTYEHSQFPYSVGEARPSPFYQFSPSWVMILKNIQDYVDYLKNRHQEAVTRTIGNVFIAKSNLIDIADFEDPEKEGKFISILPEGQNMDIGQIVRQVPMVDMTANFLGEMKGFISFAEATSGANQNLQGQSAGGGVTATEFSGTQQMAAGRLSAIARLLSVSAIVPQTKRFVANFQQFFDDTLYRKISGVDPQTAEEFSNGPFIITNDVIQGTFTYRAHDGALPGPDAKKVAAITRALEGMQQFPDMFKPADGNLDPRELFLTLIRASGEDPEKYRWRPAAIQKALALLQQAQQAAAAQPKPIPPVKPSLAVAAKIGELTPAERFQIMADIGINESGTGGPTPPGIIPHPGGPPTTAGLPPPPMGHRPSHLPISGAPNPRHAPRGPRPGPRPGMASAMQALRGPTMPSAGPPQVHPGNT